MKRFSNDVIKPLVREMDKTGIMDPRVIAGTFENGLMGIEVPEEYGGANAPYFSIPIIVEELAKIDPAIATYVDVHNTLVVPMLVGKIYY